MSSLKLFETSLDLSPLSEGAPRYRYIPFEVPSEVDLLEIGYKVEGDATVDLGIFEGDSASARPPISSFRGWSGSNRSSVIVGNSFSTPGYACGPLQPGRWWISLGLPKVRGQARVSVEIKAISSREIASFQSSPILERGVPRLPEDLEKARECVRTIPGVPITRSLPGHRAGMLCGDFHTHSWHSGDAKTSIVEMVAAAESRRMNFLAITDHNTNTHWAEIDAVQPHTEVTLVKGQEVTTYYGHFNAFLAGRIVEFRVETDNDLSEAIAGVSRDVALLSINHPKAVGPPWKFSHHEAFEAMEAWQAPWLWFNNESMRKWDELLRSGRSITGIGGSDVHDLRALPAHQYGCPATWVYSPGGKSPTAIVDAVRRGSVCVTATPDSAIAVLERRVSAGSGMEWVPAMGSTIDCEEQLRARVLGAGGRVVMRIVGEAERVDEWMAEEGDFEVCLDDPSVYGRWLRLEVWGSGIYAAGPVGTSESALLAFTNPVFVAEA